MPIYVENTFPSRIAGRTRQAGRIERCLTLGPLRIAPGRGRCVTEAFLQTYRGVVTGYHESQNCRLWAVTETGAIRHEIAPDGTRLYLLSTESVPVGEVVDTEPPPAVEPPAPPMGSVTRIPGVTHSDSCEALMEEGHGCSCFPRDPSRETPVLSPDVSGPPVLGVSEELIAVQDEIDREIVKILEAEVEGSKIPLDEEPVAVPELTYEATVTALVMHKRTDLEKMLRDLKRAYSKADDKDALARKILGPKGGEE